MTVDSQTKPWNDLEDQDLAWFILKAYEEGKIDGDQLSHFISMSVYYENGSLYTSSTKVMTDFLEEHYDG